MSDEEDAGEAGAKEITLSRVRLDLWTHFDRGGKYKSCTQSEAFCKFCEAHSSFDGVRVAIRGERKYMTEHLQKCRHVPAAVHRALFKAEIVEHEKLMARAFASANLPYAAIENPEVVEWLKWLRPGIQFPTQRVLRGRIIRQHAQTAQKAMEAALNGKRFLTLTFDGFKNVSKRNILGAAVTWRDETDGQVENYVIAADDVSTEGSTADDVVVYASKWIDTVTNKYNADLGFSVCDSASYNVKARRILSLKFPRILFESCKAHQINLVVKDMLQLGMFVPTCKSALKVVSHFNQNIVSLGRLRKSQLATEKKQLPFRSQPTHDGTPIITASALCWTAKKVYGSSSSQVMAVAKEIPDEMVCTILDDITFWGNLKKVEHILKPVVSAQGQLEKDGCTLSDVMTAMYELYHCFKIVDDGALSDNLTAALENRWMKFFTPSLLVLAAVLDYSKRLEFFRPRDERLTWQTVAFLASKYYEKVFGRKPTSLLRSFTMYKNWIQPFAKDTVKQFDNPFYFWSLIDDQHSELRDLAIFLLSGGVHSAYLERYWSRYAYINTDIRNRLTTASVMNAALIAHHAKRDRRQKEKREKKDAKTLAAAFDMEDEELEIVGTSGGTVFGVSGDADGGPDDGESTDFDSLVAFYCELVNACDEENTLNSNDADFYSLDDLFGG
ncbi:uncharacterized protein LOC129598689 [Paramacrobiotus metropolitanus]|uniref:uncharacterized protein LOC129598689 n=1 Tax=Paramacrobiotus metropolitanus TaxID=2943436 RepID=UPI0024463882|nr:uncharacterized protein LOC129598689 [Paramacrobiotus metropolitanus]